MLLEMVKKEKLSSMYILNYAKKYYKDIYLHKLIDFIFVPLKTLFSKSFFKRKKLTDFIVLKSIKKSSCDLVKNLQPLFGCRCQ